MEKEIKEFLNHLEKSVHGQKGLLDMFYTGKDYESRFDLKLEMNGQSISLPLHADLFMRITTLLEEEMEEEI